MLVKTNEQPTVAKELDATICWMDKDPLEASNKYYVKHGVNDVQAKIMSLSSIIKTDFSGTEENPSQLTLNEIGDVTLKLSKPLFFDSYDKNKANGTFILINPKTNNTAGVGFIK
jgi:sulfate adenylyltransferase subunit 1